MNQQNNDSHKKDVTSEDLDNAAKQRVSVIDKEFTEGFEFIKRYPKSVSFFGSAVMKKSDPHYDIARKLAGNLAKLGYTIVTGGGPGIMEAANRGAFEAGGQSVGFNIKLPNEQKHNDYLTDYCEFYYFFSRKVVLSFAAEAYIFMPGGYGTLNEFFEIATLVQTERIKPLPIILVGSDYWKPLDHFLREDLLKIHKVVDEKALSIYKITDNENEIIDTIVKSPVVRDLPFHVKN